MTLPLIQKFLKPQIFSLCPSLEQKPNIWKILIIQTNTRIKGSSSCRRRYFKQIGISKNLIFRTNLGGRNIKGYLISKMVHYWVPASSHNLPGTSKQGTDWPGCEQCAKRDTQAQGTRVVSEGRTGTTAARPVSEGA